MAGERHLSSAKKLPDIYLAEVRKLEIEYRARHSHSLERAGLLAEALKTEHDQTLVRDLIYNEGERAVS